MKYLAKIDLENKNNSHTLTCELVDKVSAGQSLNILEVGCSSGYLGAALKEVGHQVFGVEPSHEAAQAAANVLDNVFEGTVQDFFLQFSDLKFDVVIYGDVLEHLANPKEILDLTRKQLTSTGVVIASVPNVAHICIRAMLLEGRWDYAELGIMDRTHLRFFTKKTLIELFTNSAYNVTNINSTTITPENFEVMFDIGVDREIISHLQSFVKNSNSLDFQYVCMATPVATSFEAKALNDELFSEQAEKAQVSEISNNMQFFENKIVEQEAEIESLRTLDKMFRESISWRVTAPLRLTKNLLKNKLKQCRNLTKSYYHFLQSEGGMVTIAQKTITSCRRDGIKGLARNVRKSIARMNVGTFERNDYAKWVRLFDTIDNSKRNKIRTAITQMKNPPLISVIMPTYNVKPKLLTEAIRSIQNQLYPNWELCIADDASTDAAIRPLLENYSRNDKRIKVVFRENNGHISAASNSALELVTADWVALMDHDDMLPEHALYYVAKTILNHPDAGMIYSDEDKIDEFGKRFSPHFKSEWNPDLFFSQSYVSHLGVYRKNILDEIGGFRVGLEGSQDYDLLLRCLPYLKDDQIIHIPKILYHWRMVEGSTALSSGEKNYTTDAGIKALQDYFSSQSEVVTVDAGPVPNTYRVHYPVLQPEPLVSLLIPTRDGREITEICVRSIITKSTYSNFEILILDNGSVQDDTLAFFEAIQLEDARVKVLRYDHPFNYSAINNFGAKHAQGEIIGLVNNDIEVISPEWLTEMVSYAVRPDVGCVGAKLYYNNDTLQHGGVILGIGDVAGHSHKHYPRAEFGYFSRLLLRQTISAVTAACLLVRRDVFEQVGGLDELNLKVAFNDVDFCLKVREAGYRNVWTAYAELYHHESISRGAEDTPEKISRFQKETKFMKNKWGSALVQDPYYSPNLTLQYEDFSLAWPPRQQDVT
jgi:O-antigen biosynthesis protein